MNNLARKEIIDQVHFFSPSDEEPTSRSNSVTEVLHHVGMDYREFVRESVKSMQRTSSFD